METHHFITIRVYLLGVMAFMLTVSLSAFLILKFHRDIIILLTGIYCAIDRCGSSWSDDMHCVYHLKNTQLNLAEKQEKDTSRLLLQHKAEEKECRQIRRLKEESNRQEKKRHKEED